jgi:uncharacterized protein YndB with AHSA1/START domain
VSDQPSGAGELTYTRIFDAPRELVFRCMIEPEHLTHFWGPAGVSAPWRTSRWTRARAGCSRPSWSTTPMAAGTPRGRSTSR